MNPLWTRSAADGFESTRRFNVQSRSEVESTTGETKYNRQNVAVLSDTDVYTKWFYSVKIVFQGFLKLKKNYEFIHFFEARG